MQNKLLFLLKVVLNKILCGAGIGCVTTATETTGPLRASRPAPGISSICEAIDISLFLIGDALYLLPGQPSLFDVDENDGFKQP